MGLERRRPVCGLLCSAAVAFAGLAVLLCVSAAWSTSSARSQGPIKPTWRTGSTSWAASAVGPRERSLVLEYTQGGCGSRNNHVAVHGTDNSVFIEMHAEFPVFPPGTVVSCPAPHKTFLTVPLARPLAGRHIRGRQTAFGGEGGESPQVVPRLIGFAPRDAYRALALRYLRGRVLLVSPLRALPRVVAQDPATGAVVVRNTIVRLRVAGG